MGRQLVQSNVTLDDRLLKRKFTTELFDAASRCDTHATGEYKT